MTKLIVKLCIIKINKKLGKLRAVRTQFDFLKIMINIFIVNRIIVTLILFLMLLFPLLL